MTRYLFVSGVGRSGTTALRRSLGLHPEIYYNGNENNLVQDVVAAAYDNCTRESRRRSMVVDQSTYNAAFRRLITELVWNDAAAAKEKPLHMAAIKLASDHVEYLLDLFAPAQIVCLVRNGISVVSSRLEHRSFRHREFQLHCERWLEGARLAKRCASSRRARIFRQEWMIEQDQLESELKELFQWLEVSWNEAPLRNILARRYLASTDPQHGQMRAVDYEKLSASERQKLEQHRLDRWKKWTEKEREMFLHLCGNSMRELGYEIPWA